MKTEQKINEIQSAHRAYIEAMDEIIPFLNVTEQAVYQRLLRLTHARGVVSVQCRYAELGEWCSISLSTLQRALRGLRAKKLVRSVWQSHGASTFYVHLLSTLPCRPTFFPRQAQTKKPPSLSLTCPPLYFSFSDEDRQLFLACKRALGPQRLNEITEQAVEWLTEECAGEANGFSDERLRDKVDELVMREVFGPDRQARYEQLFSSVRYP